MFEAKLLRRPLPPKVERERLTPKRKSYKGVIEESEPLRGYAIFDSHHPLASLKTEQPVFQFFPDYDLGTKLLVPLSRSFVFPPQPSGPPSFPSQKNAVPARFRISVLKRYPSDFVSDFMLQGLTAVTYLPSRFLTSTVKKPPILSRVNYEVLTSELIAEERRGPQRVANIILSFEDFPYIRRRKPERQMLLERVFEQKVLFGEEKEEEEESILGEEKRILEQTKKKKKKKRVTYAESVQDLGFAESLISGIACKPKMRLEEEASQSLSKAEIAIFSCLVHRRTGLSLKAFFLSQLPDLSLLADFLLYLNLSFNFLDVFPEEVYCLVHLEILKLRNNPIRFIPEEISQMTSLKCLVMSFNLLTTLPPGLFALPNLEYLDVSYNELESIPDDIRNLSKLAYLNVEGNLLYVLPCGILKLPLAHLKVENNFLHPYIWGEMCTLEPQRLTDMAAHCFAKHRLWERYREITVKVHEILWNSTTCDCCMGPLYGKGLEFICIYKNNYGLRLPYLFHACSSTCYMDFMNATSSG